MADAQFLSQPDDALIHAQPRFETNGEKVQAVGEAHSNLVDTPVRCPLQPEVGKKEAHPDGNKERHDDIAAHERGHEHAEDCGNG